MHLSCSLSNVNSLKSRFRNPFLSPITSTICSKKKDKIASSNHRNLIFTPISSRFSLSAYTCTAGRRTLVQLKKGMDLDAAVAASYENENEDFISVDAKEGGAADLEELVQSIVSVEGEFGESSGDGYASEGRYEDEDGLNQNRDLPEELLHNVVMLSCESSASGGICDVYLVGTAHVSKESCREVEAVISFLKPQVVFLELCSSRVAVLSPQNLKVPTMADMIDMWKKNHNLFGVLYSWFLAKVASKLEVFPGAEFRTGYDEAMKYGGKVILGDRPVNVTLRRTWGKMPLWHKTKLIYSLLFQALFLPDPEELNRMLKEMDDIDMLTLVIQEMSKQFPTLMETLVHERDQYMSSMLLRVAGDHNSVVAVVGKGHLQGIKKHWKQPVEMTRLLNMDLQPPSRAISVTKVLTFIGVAVAGAAIISGIYMSSKK
ncbi:traB domain-containing protein-like [Impatiens glandulifera]|uniref:traB domain-containing protein-like n=1 Tax=Impatiens glandulifera TaxID=253017 RepID=UPI001FB16C62|nr:traB domain-containing protein-like [Impatiens glandulifera]